MPSLPLIHKQLYDHDDMIDESDESTGTAPPASCSIPQEYIWPEHERPSCSIAMVASGGHYMHGEDEDVMIRRRRKMKSYSISHEYMDEVGGRPGAEMSTVTLDTEASGEDAGLSDGPGPLADVKRLGPMTSIPVIDFQQVVSDGAVGRLAQACREWGVFYLVGHDGLMTREAAEVAAHLFSLPLHAKLRAARQDGCLEGFGKAMIAKFFKCRLWSEGLTLLGHPSQCSIANIIDRLLHCTDADPPPPPPAAAHHDRASVRRTLEEYDLTMRRLAGKLLQCIMEGIGVDIAEFKRAQFDPERDCHGVLQLNHYPPCPEPLMTIGLPPHTDSTCLSIVHQGDGVPGLQVQRHGSWIPVPPIQGALVVHVGDMLQVLSNGIYRSILHRAVANKEKSRVSLVYLCIPPLNVPIAPCHKEIESMYTDPIYKPMQWKDYLQAKNKYFLGALDHFKIVAN